MTQEEARALPQRLSYMNGMSDTRPPPKSTPPPALPEAAPAAKPKNDVVLLGPPTADGNGVHVLRARDERLEAGELRAVAEGKPLAGELVTLEPRKDDPRVCDVKESFRLPPGAVAASPSVDSGRASSATRPGALPKKGPAQVANDAYRENWDEIFGKKRGPSGGALN